MYFQPYIACTLWLAHHSTIRIRSCFTIRLNTNRLFSSLFGTEANIRYSPTFVMAFFQRLLQLRFGPHKFSKEEPFGIAGLDFSTGQMLFLLPN